MRNTRMREPNQEVARFQMRLGAAGAAVLIGFSVLLVRFVYLQVLQHAYYATRAEDNRISIVPIQPTRGLILDRNGIVLARNYSAYTLEINPNKVDAEKTMDALSEVIAVEQRDRRRFRRLLEETRGADSIPIRTRLSDEEVARFAANRYRFPGVEIKARLFREYPYQATASHAIGYIGRISDRDVEKLEQENLVAEYRGTDYIGKTGLEATYERELHGQTGSAEVEIDANGRAIRTLRSTAPVPGNNVDLTIDIKLQQVAERAFGDYRGALVAIEPSTGGVLAFISKPGYDPNLFVDGIDPQNWETLNNNPDRPLNNRALAGAYPPGSTIKPFLALAALQTGKRSPASAINDPGYFTLPGVAHRWRDWKTGGHGYVDMHRAIVQSCDIYFYGVGNDLGVDTIHSFFRQFGFGEKTGIDIDGERAGVLPSTEWKMARFKQKWFAGDTISVAIGQGYFTATPMQLAYAVAVLANGGVAYRPHMARYIHDAQTGLKHGLADEPLRTVPLDPKWVDFVKQAMVDVTKPGGTAGQAGKDAAYSFAGKTGTAQVVGIKQNEKYDEKRVAERLRDHALFIAFAPAENPRIALSVLVENGQHGATTAAPIARTVLDYYLLGKVPDSMPDMQQDEEGD